MSLFKQAKSPYWWISFTGSDGKRIKRSSGTVDKKAAQELHDTLKAGVWRERKLSQAPDHTFDELAVQYLRSELGSKYYASRATMVAYWLGRFAGQPVRSLTSNAIKSALPTKLLVEHLSDRTMSPATQNRYLSCISKMLSVAVDLEWIEFKPVVKLKREPKVNVRWITHQECDRLIAACHKKWLQDIVRFALATGCRAGEIINLEWSEVDLDKSHAWITGDKAKSGYSRGIPLNREAKASMAGRACVGRVFLGPTGNELNAISRKSFQAACAKAGIENFRFHDLRHTFASHHIQNGTPLMVLKELGGWEDITMVQKYAHLGQSHLAQYAENVLIRSYQRKPKDVKIA